MSFLSSPPPFPRISRPPAWVLFPYLLLSHPLLLDPACFLQMILSSVQIICHSNLAATPAPLPPPVIIPLSSRILCGSSFQERKCLCMSGWGKVFGAICESRLEQLSSGGRSESRNGNPQSNKFFALFVLSFKRGAVSAVCVLQGKS